MLTVEQINEKWTDIINEEEAPKIDDSYRKKVTAIILEQQEKVTLEEAGLINEAPTNIAGTSGNGAISNYDPILISLVRRTFPVSIAFDIFGVQPMKMPTGLIFAMKSKYADNADLKLASEALHNEANTGWSGNSDFDGGSVFDGTGNAPNDQAAADIALDATTAPNPWTVNSTTYGVGTGYTTAEAELLGDASGTAWKEMGFSIEKKTVEAKSRGLKTSWTVEMAQDLKSVHGLNAESELANILSNELTAEMNREMVRRCMIMSKPGAQTDTTTPGVFDLDVDSNGRWSVERFKGLMFQIERDANAIAIDTRRGKGNFIITSADVASALAMTGLLDSNPAFLNGTVDVASSSYVGVLNGTTKVFVDPFVTSNGVLVGYKGSSPYDAGAFYCPYVPFTMYKATGEDTFQPRMGFKTRAGFTVNPFVSLTDDIVASNNPYYRKFAVEGLM